MPFTIDKHSLASHLTIAPPARMIAGLPATSQKELPMSPAARLNLKLAAFRIGVANYDGAIRCLRLALKETQDRRAWSKIMLAIRELHRIAPAPSAQ